MIVMISFHVIFMCFLYEDETIAGHFRKQYYPHSLWDSKATNKEQSVKGLSGHKECNLFLSRWNMKHSPMIHI